LVLDRVTARPEDLSGLTLSIDCEEAEKVAELYATVEVEVAWIRYNAGLCDLIPHRSLSARFGSACASIQLVEVADAVFILVYQAIASTDSYGVKSIAIAVALAVGNDVAATADPTIVQCVALAIACSLGNAIAATDATFVKDVALTIAVAWKDSLSPTYTTLVKVEAGPVIRCSG
jgi:hypothetical protein